MHVQTHAYIRHNSITKEAKEEQVVDRRNKVRHFY